MWVPFLRPFPGNEAHKLFSGGPKSGVLGGGKKVYVEKVYVLFRSPMEKLLSQFRVKLYMWTVDFPEGMLYELIPLQVSAS